MMGAGIKRAIAATKRTRTPAKVAPAFTAAEREVLGPLIDLAALAAMAQSKAEATKEAKRRDPFLAGPSYGSLYDRANAAERETCAAGKALADALAKLRRGAKAPAALTDPTRHALKRLRETTAPGLKIGKRNGAALVAMGYAVSIGEDCYRVTGEGRMVRL